MYNIIRCSGEANVGHPTFPYQKLDYPASQLDRYARNRCSSSWNPSFQIILTKPILMQLWKFPAIFAKQLNRRRKKSLEK